MPRPSDFTINTDYPTLKNDDHDDVTITVGGSISIAGNASYQINTDINIGKAGAINRGAISSSKNSSLLYALQAVNFERAGTSGGGSASYQISCFMYRISADTLRLQVYILNPYGVTLVTESGVDYVRFVVNTMITPFTT